MFIVLTLDKGDVFVKGCCELAGCGAELGLDVVKELGDVHFEFVRVHLDRFVLALVVKSTQVEEFAS